MNSLGLLLKDSPLGTRLAGGAFWSVLGAFTSRGIGLISWVLVGRLLGKEGFGELGIVQSTVGMFGSIAGLGMGLAATKYVAEFRRSDPMRAGRVIAMASVLSWIGSAVLASLLAFFAHDLASQTLAAPGLGYILQWSSVLLFLSALAGTQSGALTGFEAFRVQSKINVISGLASFPLLLGGAWLAGVWGAIWGLTAAAGLQALLNWRALRDECRRSDVQVQYSTCLSEISIVWKFNVPGLLNALILAFVSWAGLAMIARLPGGIGEVGVFSAALRMKQIPETLVAMVLAPILPILSSAFSQNDNDTCAKTLTFAYGVSSLIILPIALVQTAAPELTFILYGSTFDGGTHIVPWLMLSAAAYALFWPIGTIFVSMGRAWRALLISILYVLLYLGLSLVLIPNYGAAGFAAAGAIAQILASLPCAYLLYAEFPDIMRATRWWQLLVGSVVAFSICCLLSLYGNRLVAVVTGGFIAVAFVIWRIYHLTDFVGRSRIRHA